MRTAATLLLFLVMGPAWAQGARASDAAEFQVQLAASVVSAALAFIVPRALEPATAQQLALWGLSAPASLDDRLSTDLRDGAVVLLRQSTVLYSSPAPPEDDTAAWGALVADALQAAGKASPAIREAGTIGALTAFFDELFNHLDPYSRYVPPAAADIDRARRSGEAGAGITVKRVGSAFVITDVNADGPAAAEGIRVGDRILAVDEQPVAGEDLETVQGMIAGLEGTDLSLTVRRGNAPARTVELERAVIPPETVFATRQGDILTVRITSFSADTDARLERELARNLPPAARPVRGLILDLRGNRGGLLRQAVAATDLLVGPGIIATTAGRNPQAAHEWRGTTPDIAGGRPVVVLVDGRSASAAEIMAAALGDQGRAVVVGSSTLGKGLVQTITSLPDGGELFVSWSRVLAPGGWPMQGLGVLPQVCTSLGADATAAQLAALERGTQTLATALARHRAARAPLPAAEALALRSPCPAAEARDSDLPTARYLIAHPAAYAAARLAPP